jgi:hypothetical protein
MNEQETTTAFRWRLNGKYRTIKFLIEIFTEKQTVLTP